LGNAGERAGGFLKRKEYDPGQRAFPLDTTRSNGILDARVPESPRSNLEPIRGAMASRRRIQLIHLSTLLILTVLGSGVTQGRALTERFGACATPATLRVDLHNDNARDGVNPNEATLNPALFPVSAAPISVFGANAGRANRAVDGLIYAQPLYLSGVSMAPRRAAQVRRTSSSWLRRTTRSMLYLDLHSERLWIHLFAYAVLDAQLQPERRIRNTFTALRR